MNFIGLRRNTGKTYKVIEWYLNDPTNRLIIAINEVEKKRLMEVYNIPSGAIITPDQALQFRGRRYEMAVDNIDIVLYYLFGNIVLATWTDNEQ